MNSNIQLAQASANISKIDEVLKTGANELMPQYYKKIVKSYRKLWVSTIIVMMSIVSCLLFFIVSFLKSNETYNNQVSKRYDLKNSTLETEHIRTGKFEDGQVRFVGEDVRNYIYVDVEDYGYDAEDFENGDKFSVYIDKNEEAIALLSQKESKEIDAKRDKGLIGIFGGMCLSTLLIIIWTLVAKSIYKDWSNWGNYVWKDKPIDLPPMAFIRNQQFVNQDIFQDIFSENEKIYKSSKRTQVMCILSIFVIVFIDAIISVFIFLL